MKSMNKVQLIGYLGRDPQFRPLKNGREMARLRLATDYWQQTADGIPEKTTSWHNVTLFNDEQVKKMKNYIIKGSHILVEGRLAYNRYTSNDGITHCITEIKASFLVDLDR